MFKTKFYLLITAFLLTFSSTVFAQLKPIPALIEQQKNNSANFTKFDELFTSNKDYAKENFDEVLNQSDVLKLNFQSLASLMEQKPVTLELTIPYKNGRLTLEMVQKSPLSEDFSVITNESKVVKYEKGLYYRGIIQGNNNSVVAISFFNNEVYGMISDSRNGDIVLGRIETKGNTEDYILYSDNDLKIKNPFACNSTDITTEQKQKMQQIIDNQSQRQVSGCVRSFLECDFELYQNKGSSVTNTVNYITAVYNNIATLYNNEQISTVTSQVLVWVTQDGYPTNNSYDVLLAFKNTRGTNYNGDLAHFVGLGGGGLGGIAWLDVLCYPFYGYAFSNISSSFNAVPTYSWTIEVMTHEMGHNLGSPHTQNCSWPGGAIDNCYTTEGGCAQGPAPTNGGTIMSYCHLTSYGINFANGFGPLPGQLIRDYVTAATCLSATCAAPSTCAAPTNLNVININANNATISWTVPIGGTATNLRYRASSSATWTTVNTVTSPYIVNNLIGNTNYNVELTTVCGTLNSGYQTGTIFKTQISTVPCDAPTNVATTTITQTGATLNWTAVNGASNYIVRYKLSTATTWTNLTVTTNTAVLTSLQANKTYNVQVMSNCTSGNYSNYSTQVDFLTLGCDAPSNLAVSNITTATANTTWGTPLGAVSYNIQYKTTAATTWTTKTSTTPNYAIIGLVQATAYDVKVQTVCSSAVGSSAYSAAVPFTTAACLLPTTFSVSNISQNTATATWDNPSAATSYKLQWRRVGTTTWSSATVTNTLTYNMIGLTPNAAYEVQIQTTCTGGLTAWSASQNFTTTACPTVSAINITNPAQNTATASWAQVLNINSYKIQWKLAIATTWSSANVTGLTYNFTNLIPNSTYNVQVTTNCTNGSSVWSATQNFTTTACPTVSAINITNPAQNTTTASWAQVLNINSYRIQWKRSTATTWTAANVTGLTYNFTNLVPNASYDVQVTTNCTNGSSVWSATQNFTTAACPTVSAINFTNIAQNTTTASWAQVLNINSYRIQWKRSTATTWTAANVTGLTYNFTNLVPNASYDVQVTTNCTNGSSVWSATQNFTTAACPMVSAVNFTNLQPNLATASWAQVLNINSYKIQWKLSAGTTWGSANVTGLTYNFTNLVPNSSYDVQVTTNCPNGSSVWSATQNFTTPVCPLPTNIALSNVGINGATVSWTAASNVTSHRVQWRKVGTTSWSGADVSANTYNITGLTANTGYEVQVRTNCANVQSLYSASSNFTTLSNPTCTVPTGLAATVVTNNSMTLNWAAVTNAVTYNIQYKLSTATAWITLNNITAAPYTISGLTGGATYNVKISTTCAGNGNATAYATQINVTLPITLKNNGNNNGNNNWAERDDLVSTNSDEIKIAPNPIKDMANINFSLKKESKIELVLVNALGQILRQESLQLQYGTLNLDMTSYPAGVYAIRTILNDKELITNSLVKE